MKKFLALGAALLAVSACNSGGDGNETKGGDNASAGSAGGAAASAAAGGNSSGSAAAGSGGTAATGGAAGGNETIQPGLWEVTLRMNMNMPGVPQGANQNRPPETRRECITPAETREMADTFAEQPENMQCSERQFTMRGGRLDGRMTCRGQNQEFRIQMTGDYTPNSFNFRQEMSGRMPGAAQPMNMQIQAQGRRVGECPPGSEDRGSGNSAAGQ